MTNNSRRRLSFVDFSHPQVWHKLLEYSEVTIALAKLITEFSNQWAKICFLAASQLHHLVMEFRKKTEIEIRGKCHLGGMMYDLWESLLLESELESQSLKKMACLMEKEISGPLGNFVTNKNLQLSINIHHRRDFDEILQKSHEIVQGMQQEYATTYNAQGVTPEFHRTHNQYVLELSGANSLLSKYQYQILPQLLQGMEQSQIEIIDTVCQTLQSIASFMQDYHEQRHCSLASFVVTSTTTNPNEELENYICSMNEACGGSNTPPVHIEFESFISASNPSSSNNHHHHHHHHHHYHNLPLHSTDQLIVYAAPVIQNQLSSRSKEMIERLKEVKKEKASLLVLINATPTRSASKHHSQHEDQQQSNKKTLHQMGDSMKRKHQLRLLELEESVLLAQQDLLKSHRHSMSSIGDNEHDAQRRTSKNIKGLWRDAFKTLKNSTTSSSGGGSGDDDSRSSFARRFSLRKKKHNEPEEDETTVDPVYETLRVAAETRKMTLSNYLQQRQQTLNKQTSLNSQGSSEPDLQASPKVPRNSSRIETEPGSTSLRPPLPPYHQQISPGKRGSTTVQLSDLPEQYTRHLSLEKPPKNNFSKANSQNDDDDS